MTLRRLLAVLIVAWCVVALMFLVNGTSTKAHPAFAPTDVWCPTQGVATADNRRC